MDRIFITKQAQEQKGKMMSDVDGLYDYMDYIEYEIYSKNGEPWIKYNVDIFGGLRGEMPLPEDLTDKMAKLHIYQNIPIMNMEFLRWEVEKVTGKNDVPDPEETSGDSFGENLITFTDYIEAWSSEEHLQRAAFEYFQNDEDWQEDWEFDNHEKRKGLLSPYFSPDTTNAYDYFTRSMSGEEAEKLLEIFQRDPFAQEVWDVTGRDVAEYQTLGEFNWEAFFDRNYEWEAYYRGDYEQRQSATGYLILWLE